VAQDATLRRITVSNDGGDVYVESSGDGSEVVLKTEKVRVTDGDVYVGTSNVGLSAQIDALKTKDDVLGERIDTLNDTQIEIRGDLDALETSTSGRLSNIDTTLASLSSTDASLSATDVSLSSRIDELNATDAQLKATDETLQTHIATLNATDAALKGVDDDLSSRIDALRDIYVNELNVTDKQLIVTDATLGSRIDSLNATHNELKSADAGLLSRIDALETAHTDYDRIDDEVASLIASLNATDATMQLEDSLLSDRVDELNATNQALSAVDASLSAQIIAMTPPKCISPGGLKLRYDGERWNCTCADGWTGATCETQPSPDTSPLACDASLPPNNGGVGNCTASLAHGSTCQPTCDDGYILEQNVTCDSGISTMAKCTPAIARSYLLDATTSLSDPLSGYQYYIIAFIPATEWLAVNTRFGSQSDALQDRRNLVLDPSSDYGTYPQSLPTDWSSQSGGFFARKRELIGNVRGDTTFRFVTGDDAYGLEIAVDDFLLKGVSNDPPTGVISELKTLWYKGFETDSAFVLTRATYEEADDPWISSGTTHTPQRDGVEIDTMIYGEGEDDTHDTLRIAHGGVRVYLGVPTLRPPATYFSVATEWDYLSNPSLQIGATAHSWSRISQVCTAHGYQLCASNNLCLDGVPPTVLESYFRHEGRQIDNWIAVSDSENEWVTYREGDQKCKTHTLVTGEKPDWGVQDSTDSAQTYFRAGLCCDVPRL